MAWLYYSNKTIVDVLIEKIQLRRPRNKFHYSLHVVLIAIVCSAFMVAKLMLRHAGYINCDGLDELQLMTRQLTEKREVS